MARDSIPLFFLSPTPWAACPNKLLFAVIAFPKLLSATLVSSKTERRKRKMPSAVDCLNHLTDCLLCAAHVCHFMYRAGRPICRMVLKIMFLKFLRLIG